MQRSPLQSQRRPLQRQRPQRQLIYCKMRVPHSKRIQVMMMRLQRSQLLKQLLLPLFALSTPLIML